MCSNHTQSNATDKCLCSQTEYDDNERRAQQQIWYDEDYGCGGGNGTMNETMMRTVVLAVEVETEFACILLLYFIIIIILSLSVVVLRQPTATAAATRFYQNNNDHKHGDVDDKQERMREKCRHNRLPIDGGMDIRD